MLKLTDRIDGLNLNTSLPPGVYFVCWRFKQKSLGLFVKLNITHARICSNLLIKVNNITSLGRLQPVPTICNLTVLIYLRRYLYSTLDNLYPRVLSCSLPPRLLNNIATLIAHIHALFNSLLINLVITAMPLVGADWLDQAPSHWLAE
jgi:hypothetical protein